MRTDEQRTKEKMQRIQRMLADPVAYRARLQRNQARFDDARGIVRRGPNKPPTAMDAKLEAMKSSQVEAFLAEKRPRWAR
jgi:hypothetical protein